MFAKGKGYLPGHLLRQLWRVSKLLLVPCVNFVQLATSRNSFFKWLPRILHTKIPHMHLNFCQTHNEPKPLCKALHESEIARFRKGRFVIIKNVETCRNTLLTRIHLDCWACGGWCALIFDFPPRADNTHSKSVFINTPELRKCARQSFHVFKTCWRNSLRTSINLLSSIEFDYTNL